MPFIGGRYYANALAGRAIEAAREAEAALQALKQKNAKSGGASGNGDEAAADSDYGDDGNEPADSVNQEKPPIHRVEIEAAELVPSHTGRSQRAFVARVHRDALPANDGANGSSSFRSPAPGQLPSRGYAAKPETHVFAGHTDLLDFLKHELGSNCSSQ